MIARLKIAPFHTARRSAVRSPTRPSPTRLLSSASLVDSEPLGELLRAAHTRYNKIRVTAPGLSWPPNFEICTRGNFYDRKTLKSCSRADALGLCQSLTHRQFGLKEPKANCLLNCTTTAASKHSELSPHSVDIWAAAENKENSLTLSCAGLT